MASTSTLSRAPRPSSLADVLDLILDKGLVVDAYVRVSVVGIELLTVDARIVIASVDTYLRYAEAVNRLDLRSTEAEGLPAMFSGDTPDDRRERREHQLDDKDGQSRQHDRPPRLKEEENGAPRRTGRELPRPTPDRGASAADEDQGLLERIVDRGRVE